MHTATRLLPGMLLLSWIASAKADLDRSPGQVIFPDQLTFTTSAPKATTFTNTGYQALTTVSVTAASGVYARSGGSCSAAPFSIAPHASCTIEHTFTPTAIQSFYQTLTATLAGGEFVEFGLAGNGNQGHLVISPETLNFYSAPVGTVGAELTASLYNGVSALRMLDVLGAPIGRAADARSCPRSFVACSACLAVPRMYYAFRTSTHFVDNCTR